MRRAAAVLLALVAGSLVLPAAAPAALAVPAVSAPTPSASPSPTPTGDPVRLAEYWLKDYGIEEAWKTTKGAGQRIAVIDTGVAHVPELDGAVADGTDFSGVGAPDGRTPVGVKDINHGTLVASVAVGRGTGPDTGMIGVAPEADVLAISTSLGAAASVPITKQIAEAMKWAVDHGATVINLSFTTNTLTWDQSWDDAFQYAFDHDVVVVVAAGNRGSGTKSVGAPATIPGVLTVAGVDPKGVASERSSTQGITIGVAAPSEDLRGVDKDGKVISWDGTSGAAPIVAGIVALVRAAHPDLDANNVINRILVTAKPVTGGGNLTQALYGHGLVDANAAVNATGIASVDENPMGSLKDWVKLYRRAAAPTPTPGQSVAPVEIEPLPAADPPLNGGTPLLPSRDSILYGTVPLIAVTLPGILVVLGVTAAARSIRSARSRTPSK
nr:S8 family serine peptidase [Microbacterium gorillae]